MTVLGDLAQATEPAAQQTWEEAVGHLGSPGAARIIELELGYRVPAPVLEVANRLLPSVAPDVTPSRSVRMEGRDPEFLTVPSAELGDATAGVIVDQVDGGPQWGIGPTRTWRSCARRSNNAGVDFGEGLRAGPSQVVSLLAPVQAKGLEFDAVIVVTPGAFLSGAFLSDGPAVSDEGGGGRLLYVALTRAVQELTVISPDDRRPPPELSP